MFALERLVACFAAEGEGVMGKSGSGIVAGCPDLVCRVCRTKVGWPHQPWCKLGNKVQLACPDCRYYDGAHTVCAYPGRNKPLRKRGV